MKEKRGGKNGIASDIAKNANTHCQQQNAQYQRCGGFIAMVTVGGFVIGIFLAVPIRQQNHKVGDQVREGVDAVSD